MLPHVSDNNQDEDGDGMKMTMLMRDLTRLYFRFALWSSGCLRACEQMLILSRPWLVPVKPLRLGHKPAELSFLLLVFFYTPLQTCKTSLTLQLAGNSDFSGILFNLLTASARGNGGQLCSWSRTCARPSELKTRNMNKNKNMKNHENTSHIIS